LVVIDVGSFVLSLKEISASAWFAYSRISVARAITKVIMAPKPTTKALNDSKYFMKTSGY
jgi:hypothetical protein